MRQIPPIQPALREGPDYDPMDRLVQDLQNIQSFLSYLDENPHNLDYLNKHLSKILELRRSISQQLDFLSNEPYNYSPIRLSMLHKENEKIFSNVEGLVGATKPFNKAHFKKFMEECEKAIEKIDGDLTP